MSPHVTGVRSSRILTLAISIASFLIFAPTAFAYTGFSGCLTTTPAGGSCFGSNRWCGNTCAADPAPATANCPAGQTFSCDTCGCVTPAAGCATPSTPNVTPCSNPAGGVYSDSCSASCVCPVGTKLASGICQPALYMNQSNSGDVTVGGSLTTGVDITAGGKLTVTGDLKSNGGDVYTANNKAIRVDGAAGSKTKLKVMNYTGSGVLFGINQNDPAYPLDVFSDGGSAIVRLNGRKPLSGTAEWVGVSLATTTLGASTQQWYAGMDDLGQFLISKGSIGSTTNPFLIDTSGRIGIGASAPASVLSVGGTAGNFQVNFAGNVTKINNVTYSWPSFQGSSNAVLVNNGSGTLSWTVPASATATTLQGAYDNDVNGGGAMLTTNATDGALVIAGDQQFQVTTSANSVFDTNTLVVDAANNRVGIGTASPAQALDVAGAVNLLKGTSSGVALRVNATEALWFDGTNFSWGNGGSGNYFADWLTVGSNTAPKKALHVVGKGVIGSATSDISTTEELKIDGGTDQDVWTNIVGSSDGTTNGDIRTVLGVVGNAKDNGFAGTATAHPFALRTNNADRMLVDPTGHVAINGASPRGWLDITGGWATPYTSNVGLYIDQSNYGPDALYIETGDDDVVINSDGKIGIGNTTPQYLLDIRANAGGFTDRILARFGSTTTGSDLDSTSTFINVDTASSTPGYSGLKLANGGKTQWDIASSPKSQWEGLFFNSYDQYGNELNQGVMVLKPDGKVGIGTVWPSASLHILSGSDVDETDMGSGYFVMGETNPRNSGDTVKTVGIDNNEIQARKKTWGDVAKPSWLGINEGGGHVSINGGKILSTGTDDSVQFMTDRAEDGNYEWVGYYSGGTRQGIMIWDGDWNSCSSTSAFCLKAEDGNKLMLKADSYVEAKTGNGTYGFIVRDQDSDNWGNIDANDGYLAIGYNNDDGPLKITNAGPGQVNIGGCFGSCWGMYTFGAAYGISASGSDVGVYGVGDKAVMAYGQTYDFYASGPGVNWGTGSSKRWKRNIVPIGDPLEKVSRLKGSYFDWDSAHGGQHDIGFIAEDVAKVLPEIVVMDPDAPGYAIGMDYSMLTPLLTEAVKALNEKVESQAKTIESLEARLEKLEAAAK